MEETQTESKSWFPLINSIWIRSRRWTFLVTWFCYHLIAKPGNKKGSLSWSDPYKRMMHLLSILWWAEKLAISARVWYLHFTGMCLFIITDMHFTWNCAFLSILSSINLFVLQIPLKKILSWTTVNFNQVTCLKFTVAHDKTEVFDMMIYISV